MLQWEVCVAAVDGGGAWRRSSSTTVTLNVVDVNDCAPQFTQSVYTFGIYEHQPADTDVGRLSAVDRDSAPYDRHRFVLVADWPPAGAFRVDAR